MVMLSVFTVADEGTEQVWGDKRAPKPLRKIWVKLDIIKLECDNTVS